ncbi:MAG TPA: VOC family protein [Planctomycetaceae bacterium]|nr:VOC family protein [Planctomycetaceae bacterium]HRF01365.1 VOC family protein [Pirellulaceae bacterium]
MKLHTYLSFDGKTEEAFETYAAILGGKVTAVNRYRDTPAAAQVSSGAQDAVMHARLEIGDRVLMGSDAIPEYPYRPIVGAQVVIDLDDPSEAERIYAALSEGGRIELPLQETFWSRKFAMFVDRFGVPWMINCV